MFNYIELFCGIGGFRNGLERVQFKNKELQEPATANRNKGGRPFQHGNLRNKRLFNCVWSNDNDEQASRIYRYNYGRNSITQRSISEIDADSIPDHNLLTAGFPCQSFSSSGKGLGFEDTRGTLFFEVARVLHHKRPRYFLLENVRNLLSNKKGETFHTVLKVLASLGYGVQWQVLNSKDFGVPQNRERVYIIGCLGEASSFPILPFQRQGEEGSRRPYEEGCKEENEGIRKLTPLETERVQGFEDDYTKFGMDKEGNVKEVAETNRYKKLGNAVTPTVITELGKKFVELINERN